jgi:hypothetical protein
MCLPFVTLNLPTDSPLQVSFCSRQGSQYDLDPDQLWLSFALLQLQVKHLTSELDSAKTALKRRDEEMARFIAATEPVKKAAADAVMRSSEEVMILAGAFPLPMLDCCYYYS